MTCYTQLVPAYKSALMHVIFKSEINSCVHKKMLIRVKNVTHKACYFVVEYSVNKWLFW